MWTNHWCHQWAAGLESDVPSGHFVGSISHRSSIRSVRNVSCAMEDFFHGKHSINNCIFSWYFDERYILDSARGRSQNVPNGTWSLSFRFLPTKRPYRDEAALSVSLPRTLQDSIMSQKIWVRDSFFKEGTFGNEAKHVSERGWLQRRHIEAVFVLINLRCRL